MKSGCNGENNDYSIITHQYLHGRANLSHTQNGENGLLSIVSISSRFHLRETKNQKPKTKKDTLTVLP
jgi:hypothetical protein